MSKAVAAISTPRGTGGIAIIRISGDSVRDIVPRLFKPRHVLSAAVDAPLPPRRAVFGDIISRGSTIDSGIAVFYPSPASYTGEDMLELSCHGGEYVTRTVLEAAFDAGCEPAAAGEFTRRAYINGKMTLAECEAVGALIDADTEEKMHLASSAVRGRLTSALDSLYSELYDMLTGLYAAIDYPDEEIDYDGEPSKIVARLLESADKLISTYKTGRAIAKGVPTVICGRPNGGKSSLYNAILKDKAAIVTPIAGTTRDVLEATASFGGITLRIADTAGLHESGDEIEAIGIDRAWEKLGEAELVLFVYDVSSREAPDVELVAKLLAEAPSAAVIAVLNKSDAADRSDISRAEGAFAELGIKRSAVISAKENELSALESAISELYNEGGVDSSSDAIIWEARHFAALTRARELLAESADMLAEQLPADAVCAQLEAALGELAMIDGRGVCEDIVAGIFSKFCVGK